MVGVTVICPNSRRCTVKINSTTQLHSILEEACYREGYDVDLYQLVHRNRLLDLSLPFRLTGLPNNVTLEMERISQSGVTSEVDVALQLSTGKRNCLKFTVDSNLLGVIEKFSKEFETGLLEGLKKGYIPSCVYMNKVYRGTDMLKETTLKSMGILGGARICLRFSMLQMLPEEVTMLQKSTEEEANRKRKLLASFDTKKTENEKREQLIQARENAYKRELEQKAIEAEKQAESKKQQRTSERCTSDYTNLEADNVEFGIEQNRATVNMQSNSRLEHLTILLNQVDTSLNSNVEDFLPEKLLDEEGRLHINSSETFPSHTTATSNEFANLKKTHLNEEAVFVNVERCERHSLRFSQKLVTIAGSVEEDDSFYELTTSDAQRLQRQLHEQAAVERFLVSKVFIDEKNKQRKLAAFQHTAIRFMFGNGDIIQAFFYSREPASHLYECVRGWLCDKSLKFSLSFGLNQNIADDPTKNLVDIEASPSSRIYVKFSNKRVKYDTLLSIQNLENGSKEEADLLCKEWLSVNMQFIPFKPTVELNEDQRRDVTEHSGNVVSHSTLSQKSTFVSAPKWFKKP